MPLTEVVYKGYDGKEYRASPKELLNMAAEDPFFPYPYPMLRSMLEQEERPDGISATGLLSDCIRCTVLKKGISYSESISAMWARWRGTMFHKVLEDYGQRGAIQEVRFWASLPDGEELHGKPDYVLPDHHALIDLKTTSSIPKWDRVWEDHNEQLQIYRWMINHASKWDKDLGGLDPHEVDIDRVGAWYMDWDDVKTLEVRTSVEIPTSSKSAKYSTKKVKVSDVWADDRVEELIVRRYVPLKEAFEMFRNDGQLPDYAADFDIERNWVHRYSPVAQQCKELYYLGEIKGLKREEEAAA